MSHKINQETSKNGTLEHHRYLKLNNTLNAMLHDYNIFDLKKASLILKNEQNSWWWWWWYIENSLINEFSIVNFGGVLMV